MNSKKLFFIFDQQNQFAPDAIVLFRKFKNWSNEDGLLGSIAFSDKRTHIPLQVADLVAFRMRKLESRARREGRQFLEIEMDGWDGRLFGTGTVQFKLYDGEALFGIMPKMLRTLRG